MSDRKKELCRYFNSPNGCKKGDNCPDFHPPCKNGKECPNKGCKFNHQHTPRKKEDKKSVLCRFGDNCKNKDDGCKFVHPTGAPNMQLQILQMQQQMQQLTIAFQQSTAALQMLQHPHQHQPNHQHQKKHQPNHQHQKKQKNHNSAPPPADGAVAPVAPPPADGAVAPAAPPPADGAVAPAAPPKLGKVGQAIALLESNLK